MEQSLPGTAGSGSPWRWVRRISAAILAMLLALVLVPVFVGPNLFDLLHVLALGWIVFLQRTLPAISWNGDLLGMAALCSVAILVLGHGLFSRMTRSIAAEQGTVWRWRWRWSIGGLILVGVSFLVGMAIGGIGHQIGWMAASPESLLEPKRHVFYEMEMIKLRSLVETSLRRTDGDLDQARAWLRGNTGRGPRLGREGTLMLERFQVLLIRDASGAMAGTIIIPRVVVDRSPEQGDAWTDHHGDRRPLAQLPDYIQRHGADLVAL